MAAFPTTRLRRLRQSQGLRSLISETELSINHFVYPLFISEEIKKPMAISSMPGIMQWTLNSVGKEAIVCLP